MGAVVGAGAMDAIPELTSTDAFAGDVDVLAREDVDTELKAEFAKDGVPNTPTALATAETFIITGVGAFVLGGTGL